jgi:regulator of chromosome condensation
MATKRQSTRGTAAKPAPASKPIPSRPIAAKQRAQEAAPEPIVKRASAAVANTKKRRSPEESAEPPKKRARAASSGNAITKKAPSKTQATKKAASKKSISKKTTTKTTPAARPIPVINEVLTQKLDVFVCGEGSSGELGLGTKNSIDVKRPRLNANLDAKTIGVVQLSAGGMHAVALTHDNQILTWGVNDQGALGRNTDWDGGLRDIEADGSSSDSDSEASDSGLNPFESTPTAIGSDKFPADVKFVQVAAGDSCSFALTDTGLVYGWGTFRVGFASFDTILFANNS